MKLLLVDDVKITVEMGKAFLENTGCEIISSSNGEEAIELINKEKPDLVLTDLFMPKMNGDELCRKIKNASDLRNVPVVIMTSAYNQENMERCRASGCDGILKKPFDKSEIINEVRKYIQIVCRADDRISVDFEAFYDFEGEQYNGRVIDISRDGMFIRNDKALPIGAEADFFILIKGDNPSKVKGEVARIVTNGTEIAGHQYPGIGIRFKDRPAEFEGIFEDFKS